jgi:dienelactone hydrolase
MRSKNFLLGLLLSLGLANSACTALQTDPGNYVVIRPHGAQTPAPTVIMAHGCDGFYYDKGRGYRNKANLIAHRYDFNVVLYDAFTPRGWAADEVCTGDRTTNGSPVPPVLRVEDTRQIARWIMKQAWHTGGISLIGYSHGGSVAMAAANDQEAAGLIRSAVAFYPNCEEGYIGSSIGKPLIPTLVHLGEADHWTPMRYCLKHKDHPNFTMHIYNNATHAWESGVNTIAIGKWPIRFNLEATHVSEERTRRFLDQTLR